MSEFEVIKNKDVRMCPLCGKQMIKHIWRGNGWRHHTPIWIGNEFTAYKRCSEPDCEDNHGEGKCQRI